MAWGLGLTELETQTGTGKCKMAFCSILIVPESFGCGVTMAKRGDGTRYSDGIIGKEHRREKRRASLSLSACRVLTQSTRQRWWRF